MPQIQLPDLVHRDGMNVIPTYLWTPDGFLVEDEDGEFRRYDAFRAPPPRQFRRFMGLPQELGEDGEWHTLPIRGGSTGAAYTLQSTTPFAAPAAVHTFLMAIAPAGHGLALAEWGISFDGVTASAVPVLVEVVNSTQAGAGTAGVSTVVTQVRGRSTGGSAPTMGGNYTAEPTTLVSLRRYYVPAFMGTFVYQAPLGREIDCDASGGTIKGLGIRITPPATVNAVGYAEVEAVG